MKKLALKNLTCCSFGVMLTEKVETRSTTTEGRTQRVCIPLIELLARNPDAEEFLEIAKKTIRDDSFRADARTPQAFQPFRGVGSLGSEAWLTNVDKASRSYQHWGALFCQGSRLQSVPFQDVSTGAG